MTTRKVPNSALQLVADSPLKFAAGEGEESKKAPIKMRARGPQALSHWYWGMVVHDMAGFHADKETIPVDWCHTDELLGFLNEFKATDDGLDVAGELVQFTEQDRVAEILHKSSQGVPYQASIYFTPESIEEVMVGATAAVNGYELAGPALIIRKWSLRGVAVCPYGYDNTTSSQFSIGSGGDLIVPVTLSEPKETMGTKTNTAPSTPTELAAPPATPPVVPVEDQRQQFTAQLQQFVAKFGAENGAKWFGEGKTFEQALELHVGVLGEALTAKDTRIAELQQKLGSIDRGETMPVTFADGEKPNSTPKQFSNLGDNLSKLAAGIKVPGK